MHEMPHERARFYAYRALSEHFSSEEDFDAYVAEISTEAARNKFLHVASIYLFLVKGGDWVVDIENSNPIIDYFTNSYKLVTVFSLIESLSTETFQDFFQWLNARERRNDFPLDRDGLKAKYDEYKAGFGSIQKCQLFFEALPQTEQDRLIGAFDLGRAQGRLSIEGVAKFLYSLRSKFVHEGKLILELGEIPHLVFEGSSATFVELSMRDLLHVFECGVLAFFRNQE